MENRVNKHVFAWVFCFLLGELGVDSKMYPIDWTD